SSFLLRRVEGHRLPLKPVPRWPQPHPAYPSRGRLRAGRRETVITHILVCTRLQAGRTSVTHHTSAPTFPFLMPGDDMPAKYIQLGAEAPAPSTMQTDGRQVK